MCYLCWVSVIGMMTGRQKYGWDLRMLAAGVALLLAPVLASGQQDLPDKPDLIRVTVDHSDDGVLIQWEASTDNDIEFYHLYKMNDRTGQRIFSFSANTLEYKHMTSGLENLAYTVTAEDSTGNESLLEDNEHRAVAISLEFDPCEPAITINWTGYEGWEGEISGYRIFGGLAGSPLQLLKFVHASTRSYIHKGVGFDRTYNYYIETVHISGMTSLSPIASITSVFPEAPEYLRVDYVSVVDRSIIELQFTADVEGPVNNFRIMKRSSGDSPYTEVETLWNSSQSTRVYQDQFPAINTSYQYLVQAVHQPENCNDPIVVSESNPGTSILLVGTLEDQMTQLTWTPYETYSEGLSGYIIQRKSGDGEFIDVQSVGPETTSWNETIQTVINGFQPGQLQYKVLAVGNPVGGNDPVISVSNIVGVAVETHLQVPNAFTPGSNDMNFEFKPVIDFAPREYILIVFDRGGRKLFETTDPGTGWDGSFSGGEFVMEGVYVYYIQYTDFTGLFRTISGNVTAIYP